MSHRRKGNPPALGVREKKIRVYSFQELSPKAKKRAIEAVRNDPVMTWNQDDSEMLTESFEQDLDDHYGLGEGMKAHWSLGYSQGDGVCFEGRVDVEKFIKAENMEKKFGRLVDRLDARIRHEARYCHWNSMDVETDLYAPTIPVAPPLAVKIVHDWEQELFLLRREWRSAWARTNEERLAPVREWEERSRRRAAERAHWKARRGEGPKAWLPGEPPAFDEPKPSPLPIPLPIEPNPEEPPDVKAANEEIERAWKEREALADEFRGHLEERVKEISRELEKNGYAEIEYHQSDEYITERLDNSDWEYLEDGRRHEGP